MRALMAAALLLLAGCATGPRPPMWTAGAMPAYPPAAQAGGLTGYVQVAYGVTATGAVIDPVVVAAEPAGVFEESALAAVRSWRYRPAREGGQPVAVERMTSTLRFSQDDSVYDPY